MPSGAEFVRFSFWPADLRLQMTTLQLYRGLMRPFVTKRLVLESLTGTLGAALATTVLAGIVALWSYLSAHAQWLDRAITAAVTACAIVWIVWLSQTFSQASPGWQPPSAQNLLYVLDELANPHHRVKLKFVATARGRPMAQALALVFEHFRWEIEVNRDPPGHVFPSTTRFNGLHVRYRPSAFQTIHSLFTALQYLAIAPQTEWFPEAAGFDFVQIEVGDRPFGLNLFL
jgi:hypothetical protein